MLVMIKIEPLINRLILLLIIWCIQTNQTYAQQNPDPQPVKASFKSIAYKDCIAKWDNEELIIKNNLIERHWKIKNGLLYNFSLKDLVTGKEKLLLPSDAASPSPEFAINENVVNTAIDAGEWQPVVIEVKSLKVTIKSRYKSYVLATHFKIYPNTAAISSWIEVEGGAKGGKKEAIKTTNAGIETPDEKTSVKTDLNEIFKFNIVHQLLGVVSLMDHTDTHDNLVNINEYLTTSPNQIVQYSANLFYLEDQFEHDGILFLKEAPLPHARPVKSPNDLQIFKEDFFAFTGLGAGDSSQRQSYPFTTILYKGGRAGRMKALQDYQRNFRVYDAGRDEFIWYSMWGDRNRDGKVQESFLLKEIDRNEEIGINHLYFIDGWQKGPSSNSVDRDKGGLWENQWSQPGYWEPNKERFPNGLDPVVKKAREKDFKIGMWYNPDRTNDFANWKKDTDVLLNFHRKYGANYFKYDGVAFNTKRGETNIMKAMHRIVQETQGKASIEIDITAGVRTGYFMAMQYGFLFLENRYTDFRRYYPHLTLRNLWQLSQFVDPRRLRIEFLNNERNKDKYPNDPLAPVHYKADHLFAITMFARPMAWLEITGLSDEYATNLKKIITIYKQHDRQIHEGNILPIGEDPKGFSWTGFQSQKPGSKEGYIVIFRELNKDQSANFTLPLIKPGNYHFEHLSGNGKSFDKKISNNLGVQISLPEELNYGFYQYKLIE